MQTEKEKNDMATKNEASNEWKKKNSDFIGFRLYHSIDADIIAYLKTVSSKQKTIKTAIRYYIANGCPDVEKKETDNE